MLEAYANSKNVLFTRKKKKRVEKTKSSEEESGVAVEEDDEEVNATAREQFVERELQFSSIEAVSFCLVPLRS
jgi:hypothetical protein